MPLTRSKNMSRIRGANTSPEVLVRKGLRAAGIHYRLQLKTPGGKADLVVPSRRLALFVDGCFWHGCPEHYVRPRTSNPFWDSKLRENVDRDRRQTLKLIAEGWSFVRVWEHALREDPAAVLARLTASLQGDGPVREAPAWRVVKVEWLDPTGGLERRFSEALLDAAQTQVEERRRSTAKTGRVKGTPVQMSPLAVRPSRSTPRRRGRSGEDG